MKGREFVSQIVKFTINSENQNSEALVLTHYF
jgi:hypothetical protein